MCLVLFARQFGIPILHGSEKCEKTDQFGSTSAIALGSKSTTSGGQAYLMSVRQCPVEAEICFCELWLEHGLTVNLRHRYFEAHT